MTNENPLNASVELRSKDTLKQKLTEIRERCVKARREVCDLASGKRQFTMNVPPQPDDTDMLICESLDRLPALLDSLEIAVGALAGFTKDYECMDELSDTSDLETAYQNAWKALTAINEKMGG